LEELDANPKAWKSISQEHELSLSNKKFEALCREPMGADFIIAASSFTKSTLIDNGIAEERIRILPYGVNHDIFKNRRVFKRETGRLKILFAGSWNQRKGLSYLAASIKALQEKNLAIELILVGRGIMDKNLISSFGINNVTYNFNVNLKDLVAIYHDADIFAFPSLCEGFGHVILRLWRPVFLL
jgi:glycosyltransferase involved in cell wall biosynthesis